ncbi:hypothetical protein GMDG_04475 [Pseudogymnoascus destructans 20631-21]|uniref:Uncharacterized protein n=1 Tax=Pseudogymnoascus destructans (strain ATCC MYA-4855 / 20631-21) TaxID=658429 RepID=L8GB29_PSED2|nr:hypothetical protein GMDG_04475 [Pseudogymnoascus destructans 20631-21]
MGISHLRIDASCVGFEQSFTLGEMSECCAASDSARHPQLTKGEIEGEIQGAGDIEFIGGKDKGGAGDYPLLSLREQRFSRDSSGRSNRVSLPRSVTWIDIRRSFSLVAEDFAAGATVEHGDKGKGKDIEGNRRVYIKRRSTGYRKRGQLIASLQTPVELSPTFKAGHRTTSRAHHKKLHNGRSRKRSTPLAIPIPKPLPRPRHHRQSRLLNFHTHLHPRLRPPHRPRRRRRLGCFPHLNPYVPTDSVAYANTRIIRIPRDWMIAGDLAPTFSATYPELLGEAGLGEAEFR